MKITIFLIIVFSASTFIFGQAIYDEKSVLQPKLFAEGIISTEADSEFDIAFTNEGFTAYFTRRKTGEPQKIYVTNFVKGKWTTPEISSFSNARDGSPFITPNGRTLYFASTRPLPNTVSKGNYDENIWKVERTENGWSSPVPLSDKINKIQVEGEEFPSSNEGLIYSNDGVIFYFSTQRRGTKGVDIYKTELRNGDFSEPEKITGEANSETLWESSVILSPDGNYIVFNTYNSPYGFGKEDILISKKTENGWSKPVNLGNLINTKDNESSPKFSYDGKYFFFSRETVKEGEEDGIWSIYFVETAALKLETLLGQEKIVRDSELNYSGNVIRLKSSGELFTGINAEYFADGKPKLWRQINNGVAEGLWMEWFANGNLRYKAFWKQNKGDGLWQYFHENGRLRTEGFYADDLAQGVHYEWHENGQLRVKRIYRDNKQTGVLTFYLPSGEVEKTEVYQDGKKIVQ